MDRAHGRQPAGGTYVFADGGGCRTANRAGWCIGRRRGDSIPSGKGMDDQPAAEAVQRRQQGISDRGRCRDVKSLGSQRQRVGSPDPWV